jgi:hypothetical protein
MKKHLVFLIILCQLNQSFAGNLMKINQYEVSPATDISIQLEVENDDPFVAFQADIPVPEGFSYVASSAALNPSRVNGHALSVNLLSGNVLRLIGYSINNTPFLGNAGTLVSITLKSGKIPATYPLLLNNALLGDSQSANILTGVTHGSVTVLAPNIVLSATALNFGRVPLGSSAEQTFQISNTGSTDLIITELNFNENQFTTTSPSNLTIGASGSQQIVVRFSPTVKGIYSKQLQITSNDSGQPTTTVTLNATGYAVNELHTGNITGASSTSGKLTFTINNMEAFTGFQFDLQLPQAMSYTAGTAQLFRHQDHSVSVSQLNNQTLRVLAFSNENRSFTATSGKVLELDFALMGVAGYYTIGVNNVIIADASGENIVSDAYSGYLNITSPDIASASNLNFGDVSMVAQKIINHRIYNYGQESLTLTQMVFSNAFFYSLQSLPVSIQPYNYVDIPVEFKKTSKGAASGTLKIYSNDPDENPFTIQLSGNAFAPNYIKIATERMHQGETKDMEVAIENEESFVAFQFDLVFPEGLTPDLQHIQLSDRKQDHIVTASLLANNTIRIVSYSPGQQSFIAKSGTVVSIPFACNINMQTGSYNIEFMNALLSNEKSENILYAAVNGMIDTGPATNTLSPSTQSWHIYPNPTTGKIHVQLNQEDVSGSVVSIINILGKIILKQEIAGEKSVEVDMTGKQPGVYFVNIKEMTRKVILK